jgi:DUF4097 and DUF4098 domain-containing protein YvlB
MLASVLVLATVLRPAHARAQDARAQDARTKLDTTYAFNKTGAVELDLIAGAIRITSWDRPSIHVVATGTGGGAFDFDGNHSRFTLSGYTIGRSKQGSVNCEISVPAGTRLRLNSIAAPVTVVGMSGSVSVSSVSGAVEITGASGAIDVDNVSGKIHVAGAPTEVHVSGVSSDVTIEGATGSAEVESVSGMVRLNNMRTNRVNVTNVSGSVSYDGWLDPQGLYDMESHSGWIALALAPKSDAWVNVETFKGAVRNTYPDAVRKTEDPDEAETNYRYTLGKGGAKVRLETFSGKIQITSR